MSAASLPVRLCGVFDPRGRADRLDAVFDRLASLYDPRSWRMARFGGEPTGGPDDPHAPLARCLRLGVLAPAAASETPDPLIRLTADGGLSAGFARLHALDAGGPDPAGRPLAGAGADLARLEAAEARGAFRRTSLGPAPLEGDYAVAFASPGAPGAGPALSLLRDPMGQRRLHHAALPGGGVAFADWVHCLRALPGAAVDPDPELLQMLLALRGLPSGLTIWPGISEVPAGARVDFAGDAAPRTFRHWTPGPDPALRGLGGEAMVEACLERARTAVLGRWRRLGASPGLTFSGGLDSSLVAAILCEADPGGPIPAYANASEDNRAAEEHAARAAMAAHLPGLALRELHHGPIDLLSGGESFWRRFAAPCIDAVRAVDLRLQERMLEDGRDAMIGGFGGDFIVSRWLTSKLHEDLVRLRLPEALREVSIRRDLGESWRSLAAGGLIRPTALWEARQRRRGIDPQLDILPRRPGRDLLARFRAEGRRTWARAAADVAEEELDAFEQDLAWCFEDQALHDAADAPPAPGRFGPPAALACGSPLLDTRLTSAVMAAPARLKVFDGQHRGLVRRMLHRLDVPAEVTRRPGKAAFHPDLQNFVRQAAPQVRGCVDRFSHLPMFRELVDPERVARFADLMEDPREPRWVFGMTAGATAWRLGEFLELVAADASPPPQEGGQGGEAAGRAGGVRGGPPIPAAPDLRAPCGP